MCEFWIGPASLHPNQGELVSTTKRAEALGFVTYQDQAMRTYVLTIPAEELEGKTEEEQLAIITERIRAQVAERTRWVGREVTI